MFRRMAMLSLVAGALALPVVSMAHDQGGQQQGGNRGGDNNRNRGGFDPGRMEQFMKEQLGNPTDEEWKVIQPKLEKVSNIRRDSMGGFFGGRSRGGDSNRGGDSSSRPQSEVAKAQQELRETLDKKDASVEDINAKLAALRSAREKSRTELKAAQKDLAEVLTARQVAALVMMGMLE